MKILGRIRGDEIVLNKDDGARALKLVDALPTTLTSGDSHAAQLRINVGTDKRGDIFVHEDEKWRKVVTPTETILGVTRIICPRISQDVQIRWIDPDDRAPYAWKHTRLLRKFGSYPQDIFDGVIVTDSYERNQYSDVMYHDYLPAGTEDGWYYRFFSFSEDEVPFSDENCLFRPIAVSWENLTQLIRDGYAARIFALGDTVTVPVKTAYQEHPFYKNLKFAVAAFNQAISEDLSHTLSITFSLVNAFGDYVTKWDNRWSEYYLTSDVYVTDRSKVYYIKNGTEYTPVTDLPLGKKLEPNTYYEKIGEESEERKTDGGNKWGSCALRKWLNSTDPTNVWMFRTNETEIGVPPPLTVMADSVVAAIAPVRNRNALPVTDRATSDYEMTVDRLYLPSMTETHGEHAIYSRYVLNTDKYPKNYGETEDTERNLQKNYFLYDEVFKVYSKAEEKDFNPDGSFDVTKTYYELFYYLYNDETKTYRLALAADYTEANEFKEGVDYYKKIVSDIAENQPLPYFWDEDLNPRIVKDSGLTAVSWWSRSGNILYKSHVRYTDAAGKLCEGDKAFVPNSDVAHQHHIIFCLTVS